MNELARLPQKARTQALTRLSVIERIFASEEPRRMAVWRASVSEGISEKSVRRWILKYHKSNGDVRSLIDLRLVGKAS